MRLRANDLPGGAKKRPARLTGIIKLFIAPLQQGVFKMLLEIQLETHPCLDFRVLPKV